MNNSNRLPALLDWLYARINYERQSKATPDSFRLNSVRLLSERLGDPHLHYPVIHVAGTKGKGSVSTMMGSILQAAGKRVGVYVSPHIETINQRILLNGVEISDEDLQSTLTKLEPVVNQIDREAADSDSIRPLTFFEIITVAAMHFFSSQKVDAAVLEVGMGGRLDSTNICQPSICVITSISFDHMQQLGNTLAKIAYEKAGIIKNGVPVISGVRPEESEAASTIQAVADERSAKLFQLGRDFHIEKISPSRFNYVAVKDTDCLDGVNLSMIGDHQCSNAAVAIAACRQLNEHGWRLSDQAIRSGLRSAVLPGRTEIVRTRPAVMLDIAHNPASIHALLETIKTLDLYRQSAQKTLIIAISKDKDARSMLAPLFACFDRIIFTAFVCNPRSRDPQELHELAREITGNAPSPRLDICPTSREAWAMAQEFTAPEDFICIAGSVFLVSDLRPLMTAPP